MSQISIVDLSLSQLRELVVSLGEPEFRANQLERWVYKGLASSFEEMTDLPQGLRQKLAEIAQVQTLIPLAEVTSSDKRTCKVLFKLVDGKTIESVLMAYDPTGRSKRRRTVCISTQAGCPFGCPFCATGQQGFERNLTAGEIIEQVLYFARRTPTRLTNLVFMGMGEPLANYRATWQAIETINRGFGLGARHMTISTVGLAPQIRRLSKERLQVGLAVSLLAPNHALRKWLLPVNRKYPLEELLESCREFSASKGRRVTFEYVLFHGVNDSPQHARELAQLLNGLNCHVNLIPANPTDSSEFKPPSKEQMLAFQHELERKGIVNTLRVEHGTDIKAGCGQLRGGRPNLSP